MTSPNSIEVHELQLKIDGKLNKIRKRKIHSDNDSSRTKINGKIIHQIKWDTIRKHIQQLQKPHKHFNKNSFKVVRPSLKNENLLDVINRIQFSQKHVIELSGAVAKYRRLQMFCIFFQCSLTIVFNAYNFVVFLLKMANQTNDAPLPLVMLLIFYGYPITSSMADIVSSVMAYNIVYENIRKTASKMDELNIYILDSVLNARISQLSTYVFNNLRTFTLYGLYNIDGTLISSIISGTTTYIIILIQYSGDGEICKTAVNSKMNGTQSHA